MAATSCACGSPAITSFMSLPQSSRPGGRCSSTRPVPGFGLDADNVDDARRREHAGCGPARRAERVNSVQFTLNDGEEATSTGGFALGERPSLRAAISAAMERRSQRSISASGARPRKSATVGVGNVVALTIRTAAVAMTQAEGVDGGLRCCCMLRRLRETGSGNFVASTFTSNGWTLPVHWPRHPAPMSSTWRRMTLNRASASARSPRRGLARFSTGCRSRAMTRLGLSRDDNFAEDGVDAADSGSRWASVRSRSRR